MGVTLIAMNLTEKLEHVFFISKRVLRGSPPEDPLQLGSDLNNKSKRWTHAEVDYMLMPTSMGFTTYLHSGKSRSSSVEGKEYFR